MPRYASMLLISSGDLNAYCPSARPSRQSRGAFIVVEQTAQTRTAANAANDAARRRRTRDQRVLQALVIALVMIVRDVFRDRPSEMPLANRNQPIEALLFDRSHEPFGVGIRIGRLIRRQHHADARFTQSRAHGRAPFRVPVTDE